jgi:hypothetical protein
MDYRFAPLGSANLAQCVHHYVRSGYSSLFTSEQRASLLGHHQSESDRMNARTMRGKSFLLDFLVTHAQKYEPLTVIFDLRHSYETNNTRHAPSRCVTLPRLSGIFTGHPRAKR